MCIVVVLLHDLDQSTLIRGSDERFSPVRYSGGRGLKRRSDLLVVPKETDYGAAFCKPGKNQTTVSIKRLYLVRWSAHDHLVRAWRRSRRIPWARAERMAFGRSFIRMDHE
ncbi:hypothetical protein [Pseudomonas sp.]|uniref:hypothetical protein n=1 Tax=Pseudomonas sp. TaxID=306 RepID=UPI003D0D2D52